MSKFCELRFLKPIFPPKSRWSIEKDMPDMLGKVVVITGGNSGIGYEIVRILAYKNARVYFASRNLEKSLKAAEKIRMATGNDNVLAYELDLSEISSIRSFVKIIKNRETNLHLLINNAGLIVTDQNLQFNSKGEELTWASNVLGPFFLTKLLLPLMLATHELDERAGRPRVIWISSSDHRLSVEGGINFEDIAMTDKLTSTVDPRYVQSKAANILQAKALAAIYPKKIISHAVHPGSINTGLFETIPKIEKLLHKPRQQPCYKGVLTPLYAATSSEAATMNGAYFVPGTRVGECRKDLSEPANAKKLWSFLEKRMECIDGSR
ncbi:putative oxidoreductase [Neolecta irregularis DAH-3]|uniref:Putative oxidoreductase n=1 Tax=Neolecta irregularis (strain DAH-3) TaxID=1198029 RepID=A0A1U7LQE9_NEOID|nr:putative oxidoreductase [Neolecta irregularis DAH-3]|eukprot:OLL24896.1 putative oxidoreductase [Neolecta irregularis DAH-3]